MNRKATNRATNRTLSFTADEMRKFGYKVVDVIVEHFDTIREKPVARRANRDVIEELFKEPVPEEGEEFEDVVDTVVKDVMGNNTCQDHPRFFAFVPGPGNFISAIVDALIGGFNIITCTWFESSGAAGVELAAVRWLSEMVGLPDEAGGLFVSGGSEANLTALAVARHEMLKDDTKDAIIYFSEQTHSSIEKGLRVLGFYQNHIRKLPPDDEFRIDIDVLRKTVAEDRRMGRKPFLVVASAGTTNTGTVDPLVELSEFCKSEGLWLHVDGAYGAAAVITKKGRRILDGIGLVDSLSIDPHKWFFQPYGIGCVLVRDMKLLRKTFQILPEYMQDAHGVDEEVNFYEYGIQMTRDFKALKFWMSLKVFGLKSFREAISWGMGLAERAEEVLSKSKRWEVITPAQLGIITFRYVTKGFTEEKLDVINEKIVDAMTEDKFALISSTIIRGQIVLRMCTINPRTTFEDIEETIAMLEGFGVELEKELR